MLQIGSLTFEDPDTERFPALNLARQAGTAGGTLPAVLNAANEVAVEAFCAGQIGFLGITETVARTMERHETVPDPGLDEIMAADQWARQAAQQIVSGK